MKIALIAAAAAGCGALSYIPAAIPTAASAYQAGAAADPQPSYAAIPPPPPAPPRTIEIFTPPPGPITDLCEDRISRPMQMRKMFLGGDGAANIAAARTMDEQVKTTWLACQDLYLANQRSAAQRAPVVVTPATMVTTAPASDAMIPMAEEPPPPPAPDPPAVVGEAPKPHRLTVAERKAIEDKRAAREAERLKKKQDREAQQHAAEVEAQRATDAFCGEIPKRSAWDGIYIGLERIFKDNANDPDSVEFLRCSEASGRPMPSCWVLTCDVRAKNMFGAKILRTLRFSKSSRGWSARD